MSDLGNFDLSLEAYGHAIDRDRKYANAYFNRAGVFAHLGLLDEAVCDYSSVVVLDPLDSDARERRAVLYDELGQHELAEIDRQEARRLTVQMN